jgi:hypothetical protein
MEKPMMSEAQRDEVKHLARKPTCRTSQARDAQPKRARSTSLTILKKQMAEQQK